MSSAAAEPAPSGRSIDRRILALALPAALTVAADPLYDITDTAILGHLGEHQLAGAALAATIMAVGYAVFIFLLFGTTATVARLVGAGRERDASEHAVQSLWLAVGLGVVVGGLVYLAGPAVIAAAGARGATRADALTYLRISTVGFPAFMVEMVGAGSMRGREDGRTPLAIAIGAVVVNLVIEVVLIYGLGYGVGASALGTVVAKWLAAAVFATAIRRRARAAGVGLRPRPAMIGSIGAAGGPLLVRTLCLQAAFLVTTACAGRMGTRPLAAFAAAGQVMSFCSVAVDGFETAGQALVATALGSGRTETARRTGRRIIAWAEGLGLVLGGLIVATHTVLPAVFTDNAALASVVATSLLWVAAIQPLAAPAFALDGILVGAGDLAFLARAMAVALAALLPIVLTATAVGAGIGWLWFGMAVFMTLRTAQSAVRFERGPRFSGSSS